MPGYPKDACVSRVGLNFNGGTGGGNLDRVEAEHWSKQLSLDSVMAGLLFSRGLLLCSPCILHGLSGWLRKLKLEEVIRALFAKAGRVSGHSRKQLENIIIVHLDELTMLNLDMGDNARALKTFANQLSEYNCNPESIGLVVPLITHTAPTPWMFNMTEIPIRRKHLIPFSFEESEQFFAGLEPISSLSERRLVSACGGHAGLLMELRSLLKKNTATLGGLFSTPPVRKLSMALNDHKLCMYLVRSILLQQKVKLEEIVEVAQLGVVSITPLEDESPCITPRESELYSLSTFYNISMPYPMLVHILLQLPGLESLRSDLIPPRAGSGREWSSKVFEHLCALRACVGATEEIAYRSPASVRDMLAAFKEDQEARFFLSSERKEEGVDGIGLHVDGHHNVLTLVQSKYPDSPSATQKPGEIGKFLDRVEKHGVPWAQLAGCSKIMAMFVTGRLAPRHAYRTPMTSVQDVEITFTLYAKPPPTSSNCVFADIKDFLPEGILCF